MSQPAPYRPTADAASNEDSSSAVDADERMAEHNVLLSRALHAVQHGDLEAAQELIEAGDSSSPTLGQVFRTYQCELETQAQQLRDSQVRTEQTLDWFANLFRTLPVAALLVDRQGRIVDANQLALDELQLKQALRTLPVPLRRLMAQADDEVRLNRLLARVVAGGTEGMDDVALRTLGGQARWADLRVTQLPPRHPGDDPEAGRLYLCILNDRTARVEAQQAREKASDAEHRRDIAESASRTKSQLLARVSHELRTPLNAVIGFSHLLLGKRAALDEESARRVALIRDAGQHLLSLVDEVLELNTAEAGKLALQMAPVDLGLIAGDVADLHQPLAAELALRLTLDRPSAPAIARADTRRVREILINLTSNAIKYNHHGGSVRIAVETTPEVVRVSVHDTGIGMTEDQLSHLFEAFNRLGADRTLVPGHGLGLSIARSFTEAMGGRLSATSVPGKGSCFVLELPRMQRSDAPSNGS